MSEKKTNKNLPIVLSQQAFLESFKNVPRLAVVLFVTDVEGKVLLTKRSIPPFAGMWHLPGSFLLKNETVSDCQKRVVRNECGLHINLGKEPSLLGAFENIKGDPRGHVIDLLYAITIVDSNAVQPTQESSEVMFFSTKKLPNEMGFNHHNILRKVRYSSRS